MGSDIRVDPGLSLEIYFVENGRQCFIIRLIILLYLQGQKSIKNDSDSRGWVTFVYPLSGLAGTN